MQEEEGLGSFPQKIPGTIIIKAQKIIIFNHVLIICMLAHNKKFSRLHTIWGR